MVERDNTSNGATKGDAPRKTWETPQVTYVGTIANIVQPGMGKSQAGADPGDFRKPPGQN